MYVPPNHRASQLGTQDIDRGTDVSGEFVRDDNTENQEGVPLALDTQVIDIDTCDPVPNVYVEIWRMSLTALNPAPR